MLFCIIIRIPVHSSIFGILKIYMPGAGCAVLVGLSIIAMIIFRKRKKKSASQVPTGIFTQLLKTINTVPKSCKLKMNNKD